MWRLWVCAVVAFLTAVFAAPGVASAHAVLLESNPGFAATLSEAPATVSLKFDTNVESALASATIAAGTIADVGGDLGTVAELSLMTAAGATTFVEFEGPGELSDGPYLVHWVVLAYDGHTMQGYIPFSIGEPAGDDIPATAVPSVPQDAPAATGGDGGGVVVPVGDVVRSVSKTVWYTAAAVAVGVWFWLGATAGRSVRLLRPAGRVASWLFAAAGVAMATTAYVSALSAGLTSSAAHAAVLSGPQVWGWLVVAGLGAASLVPHAPFGPHVAALAAVTVNAAGSHVAERGVDVVDAAMSAAHAGAAVLWAGPLLMLWWLRREISDPAFAAGVAAGLVRYGKVAAVSLAVLAATGFRQLWVLSDELIPAGPWGTLLMVKLTVFAVTVAPFGVFHHLAVRSARAPGGLPALRRTVALELAGAAGVFGAAAVLSIASPYA